jgi:hypothetical protein
VLQQKENEIIYVDYDGECYAIIVQDMFDKTKFMQIFKDFKGMSQTTIEPIIKADFVDNGQKIDVTYLDEDYNEVLVSFDLLDVNQ